MILTGLAPSTHDPSPAHAARQLLAQTCEIEFLTRLLLDASPSETESSLWGGEGEQQFRSLLAAEQAKAIAQSGRIGIAEMIMRQGGVDHA